MIVFWVFIVALLQPPGGRELLQALGEQLLLPDHPFLASLLVCVPVLEDQSAHRGDARPERLLLLPLLLVVTLQPIYLRLMSHGPSVLALHEGLIAILQLLLRRFRFRLLWPGLCISDDWLMPQVMVEGPRAPAQLWFECTLVGFFDQSRRLRLYLLSADLLLPSLQPLNDLWLRRPILLSFPAAATFGVEPLRLR